MTILQLGGPCLLVHGGAKELKPSEKSDGTIERSCDGIASALTAGRAILESGGSAVDAVVAAVRFLEDHADFNAGTGSSLNAEGLVQMDSGIMEGSGRRVGAVTNVHRLRHPVEAARIVLNESEHVLLCGTEADDFALARGGEHASQFDLVTDHARSELAEELTGQSAGGHDTVGAVALDAEGRLAAATSTGGLAGQAPGRVADSCCPGAGLWADESTAVAATGEGEYFLRTSFAHRVAAETSRTDLGAACVAALADVDRLGGTGGCIALQADGTAVIHFNTEIMYSGWSDQRGHQHMGLWPEDFEV